MIIESSGRVSRVSRNAFRHGNNLMPSNCLPSEYNRCLAAVETLDCLPGRHWKLSQKTNWRQTSPNMCFHERSMHVSHSCVAQHAVVWFSIKAAE